HAVSTLPEECTSEDFQIGLIQYCLDKATWEYSLMAGRLYAALMLKQIHNGVYPTVMELHGKLIVAGLMVPLNYSKEEYDLVEQMIDHELNLKSAHYSLHQIRYKYSLRNKVDGIEYETPQFVYMRMAMALAENEPKETRMIDVAKWYEHLSHKRINAPTPYYVNLGTKLDGYASCCLYTTNDTWPSLAAGDHIAYAMTCMSAGIGSHIKTRSLNDKVRGGLIQHQGKIPYYRALVGAINANLQNGRGGAATVHYTAYDPEVEVIASLKNPMTPASKQVRGVDYSFGSNRFFARLAAKNQEVALFSYADAPELYEAQYGKDSNKFERLYNEFLKSDKKRTMVPARKIVQNALNEAFETGRHYLHFTDTINHHTPFKDPIYSSNLCQEVALPTVGFDSVEDLYKPYEEGKGEVAICNIAGIIPSNITSDSQYAEVAYYALKMIDVGIHKSTYVFKNLEDTAKSRLSAGVGIIGLAHLMAKKNKKFTDQDGKNFIHETFETHAWHLYNASLRLGKEKGNAPWMHKTKFPEGWTPLDTYEKRVDELVTIENKRDWKSLSEKIIANRGIRNSVVGCHMPGESSANASETTNGTYPIRDYDLLKTNDTMAMRWVAPDATKYKDRYQLAWDIPTQDLIECYAIMQKWTDQAISADLYRKLQGDEKVGTKEMLKSYFDLAKYGVKTRYYQNSLTAKAIDLNSSEDVGCGSGGCSL
ncbi:MAG TPA: ribonucleoside-diphosphate reductase subunit alpha, partial [Methanosarcina sp.]|nr:ribonucleoside-diphosphate reductase subunit alpha [Methanosarcina sp.]